MVVFQQDVLFRQTLGCVAQWANILSLLLPAGVSVTNTFLDVVGGEARWPALHQCSPLLPDASSYSQGDIKFLSPSRVVLTHGNGQWRVINRLIQGYKSFSLAKQLAGCDFSGNPTSSCVIPWYPPPSQPPLIDIWLSRWVKSASENKRQAQKVWLPTPSSIRTVCESGQCVLVSRWRSINTSFQSSPPLCTVICNRLSFVGKKLIH